jgi:hypothetical protein
MNDKIGIIQILEQLSSEKKNRLLQEKISRKTSVEKRQ